MQKPIFYFYKLNTWDRVTIILYLVLSFGLGFYCYYSTDSAVQRDIIFSFSFLTPFFLYVINYKSLRNLTVYLFWLSVGIIHLYIYWRLKDNVSLIYRNGQSAVYGFRNTLFLLFLFQVLRFISAKTQHQELICPSIGLKTDLFSERSATIIDIVLLVVYVAATFYLLYN